MQIFSQHTTFFTGQIGYMFRPFIQAIPQPISGIPLMVFGMAWNGLDKGPVANLTSIKCCVLTDYLRVSFCWSIETPMGMYQVKTKANNLNTEYFKEGNTLERRVATATPSTKFHDQHWSSIQTAFSMQHVFSSYNLVVVFSICNLRTHHAVRSATTRFVYPYTDRLFQALMVLSAVPSERLDSTSN